MKTTKQRIASIYQRIEGINRSMRKFSRELELARKQADLLERQESTQEAAELRKHTSTMYNESWKQIEEIFRPKIEAIRQAEQANVNRFVRDAHRLFLEVKEGVQPEEDLISLLNGAFFIDTEGKRIEGRPEDIKKSGIVRQLEKFYGYSVQYSLHTA